MWIFLSLISVILIYLIIKTNKRVTSLENKIFKIKKNIKKKTNARALLIDDAIKIIKSYDEYNVFDYSSLSDAKKYSILSEAENSSPFLKENLEFSKIMQNIGVCNQEIKKNKELLDVYMNKYSMCFNNPPYNLITKYLEIKKRTNFDNKCNNKDNDYLQLLFLIKKIAYIIAFDFAIIAFFYCLFGRDKNIFLGLLGFLVIMAGVIISNFVVLKVKIPMWSFFVVSGIICSFGIYSSFMVNEPKRIKTAKIEAKQEELQEIRDSFVTKDLYVGDTSSSTTEITKVSDLNSNTLNKLNEFSQLDLTSGFDASAYNSLSNDMDRMLETITMANSTTLPVFHIDTNGNREFTQKDISLHSISLFVPKDNNGNGLIKLNYRLKIGFKWEDQNGRERKIKTPIFVSYVWNIDLNNKKVPVSNYNSFKFDYANATIDYDSWYQKNIVSERNGYNVNERILLKIKAL